MNTIPSIENIAAFDSIIIQIDCKWKSTYLKWNMCEKGKERIYVPKVAYFLLPMRFLKIFNFHQRTKIQDDWWNIKTRLEIHRIAIGIEFKVLSFEATFRI